MKQTPYVSITFEWASSKNWIRNAQQLDLCAEFIFSLHFYFKASHPKTWNENWPTGSVAFLWILILKMCSSFTFLSPSIHHIDKTPTCSFVVDDEHVLLYVLFMLPTQDQKIVSSSKSKWKSSIPIAEFSPKSCTRYTQKKNFFPVFQTFIEIRIYLFIFYLFSCFVIPWR